MQRKFISIFFLLMLSLYSCGVTRINPERNMRFIVLDEYVIPPNTIFQGEEVGGLSGIDYKDGKLLLVDDRATRPIIYSVDFIEKGRTIDTLIFRHAINLKKTDANAFAPVSMDLESVRFSPHDTQFYWVANEGNIAQNKSPGVFKISKEGKYISALALPNYWQVPNENALRNNAVFEAMDFSYRKTEVCVTTELPLKEDGPKPRLWNTFSPVRLICFNKESLQPENAYVYDLDRVVRLPFLPFTINGVTEILNYSEHEFFVIERAFSAGRGKASNRVKLFLASTKNATDVLANETLTKRKNYSIMKKELVLDFKKIRKKLPSKRIDNIEGLCYGPRLPNGNKTLLLVSDNNFNSFMPQITQIIWLEMIE